MDQELLLHDIILNCIYDRDYKARLLFKEALVSGIEVGWGGVIPLSPLIQGELVRCNIGLRQQLVEVPIAQFLPVVPAYLCQHQVAVDYLTQFVLVAVDD